MAHDIHVKFNFHYPQNKVLMAYGHLILSHVAFGRFHDALAGLSGCDRDCMMVKLRIFAIRQFMERVCCTLLPCGDLHPSPGFSTCVTWAGNSTSRAFLIFFKCVCVCMHVRVVLVEEHLSR